MNDLPFSINCKNLLFSGIFKIFCYVNFIFDYEDLQL